MPSEEKRRLLIDLARALFLERGYEKVTVSDITSQLHWAKGLFYHFYKSKTELLAAICDELAGELYQSIPSMALGERNGSIIALEHTLRAAVGLELKPQARTAQLVRSVFEPANTYLRLGLRDSILNVFTRECNRLTAKAAGSEEIFAMYPDYVGGVVLRVVLNLADEAARTMLDRTEARDELLSGMLNIYRDALQRLLEAEFGLLRIAEVGDILALADLVASQNCEG